MDDVVIVGGGPAGAMAGIVLARAGLRVRLFDRDRFPRPKLCGDTLNPGGCRALGQWLPVETILSAARPIDGMVLTGPRGVRVRGRYRDGINGYSIERRALDHVLLNQAAASGAQVEQESPVEEAVVTAGRVVGVRVRTRGASRRHDARLVIAADGRHSRIAFALGLARHPLRPRRWAIGAYFEDVDGLSHAGEMHVRCGHYIGVAPLPGGIANACLVLPYEPGSRSGQEPLKPATKLLSTITQDPVLASRFARARMIEPPAVLGPMAVDVAVPGAPGLLLAGDAAGFIDPMTGDGLTFALRGSVLAAEVAIDVLDGKIAGEHAAERLGAARAAAFRAKWRFNRSLRRLVASARSVSAAAIAAQAFPQAFERIICYAGDA